MSIASIIVSVDLGRSAAGRVRLAADLAGRLDASLTGVAARKIVLSATAGELAAAQDTYEEERAKLAADVTKARDVFNHSAGEAPRTKWRQAESGSEAFLVKVARGGDLIVLGRDPLQDGAGAMTADPGSVLLEAGRPVLVVPPGIDRLKASRVVVAWKDAPEARRAVSSALPFITRADDVFVVSAGDEARFQGAEEVAELLAQHRAHVTTHLLDVPAHDVADELIQFTAHQNADLIVIGGYGHSRLRQCLFGGVTREILQHTPVCCLMSH